MLDMAKLEQLGFHTEEGLAYCADDPEFYEEMLCEFLNESGQRVSALQRFFANRDWAQYAIGAHSLKSTSRMIGAKELSETARLMEVAGKEKDEAALLTNHELFMVEVTSIAKGLRSVLHAEG